jgi:hypothetical protein
MEESISKAAGATFGEYVAPEEFRRMIWSIGRPAAERTTAYKIRRAFEASENSQIEAATERAQAAPPSLRLIQPEEHAPYAEGAY